MSLCIQLILVRQKYYIGCADNFDACNKQAGIQEGPLNTWLSANQSKVAYERDYDKLCKCVFYKQKVNKHNFPSQPGSKFERPSALKNFKNQF